MLDPRVKKNITFPLLLGIFAFFVSHMVYAQTAQPVAPATSVTSDAEALKSLILPVSSRDVFPRLPASKLCTKDKIVGLWKLAMLYEVPAGREMKSYVTHPLQYFVFDADLRSAEYKSIIRNINLREVKSLAMANSDLVRQFVVTESGMIFFYKNSIAVDSLACFIVDVNLPPFRAGQMLIMPPEKAAAGVRMLRVYERAYLEFESNP